jgi:hypothetical protein
MLMITLLTDQLAELDYSEHIAPLGHIILTALTGLCSYSLMLHAKKQHIKTFHRLHRSHYELGASIQIITPPTWLK